MARIHRVRPPTHIPQASLADLAFLLLIFFIATTTIGEEFALSLLLPARSSSRTILDREDVIVISTDPAGSVFYVDGLETALHDMAGVIRSRQAGNDRLVISVEPDRAAPYRAMVDILDELKLARATRISLKTRKP